MAEITDDIQLHSYSVSGDFKIIAVKIKTTKLVDGIPITDGIISGLPAAAPGDDLTNYPAEIIAVANTIWNQALINAYQQNLLEQSNLI